MTVYFSIILFEFSLFLLELVSPQSTKLSFKRKIKNMIVFHWEMAVITFLFFYVIFYAFPKKLITRK